MRGYLQNIPSIGVRPKFLILYGLRRSVARNLERVEHFAGLSARESAAHETGENHRQRLLNGPGVAQGIEQIFGETWAGVDIGYVGSAQLLVEVAVGAGADGWGSAEEAVGFGVATERILGCPGFHGGPFVA